MIWDFLLGFAVGVLCVFGSLGLLAAIVCAAWRDSMLKFLSGQGAWLE